MEPKTILNTGANSGIGPEKAKLADIMGAKCYPAYADRKELQEKIWDICQKLVTHP